MSDMGNAGAERQSPRPDQPIVAFDFDGTLTIRDSFTEFLRWRAGPGAWALGLVKLAPALAAYAKDRDRGRIKAASVKEFLLGVSRQTLETEAAAFAEEIWPRFMRPDALEVLEAVVRVATTQALLQGATVPEKDMLFSGNAKRLWGLG